MTVKRMDNVGIVVEDSRVAVYFLCGPAPARATARPLVGITLGAQET